MSASRAHLAVAADVLEEIGQWPLGTAAVPLLHERGMEVPLLRGGGDWGDRGEPIRSSQSDDCGDGHYGDYASEDGDGGTYQLSYGCGVGGFNDGDGRNIGNYATQ